MAHIILVTGGSRSGKSAHALRPGQRPRRAARVRRDLPAAGRRDAGAHPQAPGSPASRPAGGRSKSPWTFRRRSRGPADCRVVLVDCLTLWVNNLLYEAEQAGRALEESDVQKQCEAVLRACAPLAGTVIFVTNEVGWGIVPENALARRFRDLSGRCNTVMAAGADEVILVVCGLPIHLKKGD